jgi:hypothetical protein
LQRHVWLNLVNNCWPDRTCADNKHSIWRSRGGIWEDIHIKKWCTTFHYRGDPFNRNSCGVPSNIFRVSLTILFPWTRQKSATIILAHQKYTLKRYFFLEDVGKNLQTLWKKLGFFLWRRRAPRSLCASTLWMPTSTWADGQSWIICYIFLHEMTQHELDIIQNC